MGELSSYAERPYAFIARYLRRRLVSHAAIVAFVVFAVGCAVSTQYAVKLLVDTLSQPAPAAGIWFAFLLLAGLIAADNLSWRLASWIASSAFVAVSGDLRRDLFMHLLGHAPNYFRDRLPGTLSGRVTATSNAVFAVENMFVWNVMPPCLGTIGAILFIATVSAPMAAVLVVIAAAVVVTMFRLAAAGKALHHDFADKAAAVDGEMLDVIGNLTVVRAFCGIGRERQRFDITLGREMGARQRSLIYLEKLRLFHAVVTVILTIALLAWAIMLWEQGLATTGAVILVCTLGLSVLHATRDLAVALVDVTQHLARLSEALVTLLQPHELRDHPEASPLVRRGASVVFNNVAFAYPGGADVFSNFSVRIEPDQRVGLVGRSGAGKTTMFALLQRFYEPQRGAVLIDDQDIRRVTQESIRQAISVVPQDISLFHRSVRENIRYGRPNATDAEVMEAAVAARCRDFIEAMPEGFETVVGDRGLKLSGGQRQRIAIARAFLKDAPILLLDEATSSLDIESEEAIREALTGLVRGRTVIAIAHRLSTLRSSDRIVVMREGRIEQDGPPDQLILNDGPYRELIKQEMSRLAKEAA